MISLENLPEEIKNHIISQTTDDYTYFDGRLHVTELVNCVRQAYFKRRFPNEPTLEKRFYFYRGKLFHQLWAPQFESSEIRVTYRLRGTPAIISGRLDFVKRGTVYDLKSCNMPPKTVNEHHAWQVAAYAYMGGYQKAVVIYVSFYPPKAFTVSLDGVEELMDKLDERARVLHDALVKNTPPDPIGKLNWSCNYCDHRAQCEALASENKLEGGEEKELMVEPDLD